MHIAICDDELKQVELLCTSLEKLCAKLHLEVSLHGFVDYKAFLSYIAKVPVDIVFLDIYIGQHNGIDAAKIIRRFNNSCSLIFVTTSLDHAIEAFDLKACHYLVKPITPQKLLEALQRTKFISSEEKTLSIVSDYMNTRLPLADIIYIDIVNKRTLIHMQNSSIVSSLIPIGKIADRLADEPRFIMCHRSIIINADFIKNFTTSDIELINQTKIPVPQKRYSHVKGLYHEYLFTKVRSTPC